MVDFVKMNGTPVRVTSLRRRGVEQVDGPPLEEVALVVILRGRVAHRSLLDLLEQGTVALEIPDGPILRVEVATSTWVATGAGEAAIYRHDLTLREIPTAPDDHPTEQTDLTAPGRADGAEVAAGVEAVRTGLRLEALIEALDRDGWVQRQSIEDAFHRLVAQRFVAEATPVVGEDAAQRAFQRLREKPPGGDGTGR